MTAEASGSDRPRAWRWAWRVALFYVLCLLGAGYAQLLAIIPGTGVSIWLLSGLLMGALLVSTTRSWPLWIAAAALAELTGNVLWFGNTLPVALMIVLGNVAESVVGALLIGRLASLPLRLRTIRDVLVLVLVGAILAPLLAAAIGAATLGWSEGQPFERAFWLFWIGDATGVLVAAPAVVIAAGWWDRRRPLPAMQRWPEAAALTIGVVLAAAASLTGQLPFGLIILPLVLLAAVRFHFWGSIVSAAALTILAAGFQLAGVNPFALVGRELEAHVQLQLFLAISTFAALVVAALASQNEETLMRLIEANRDLEQRVDERTARLAASEGRLKKVLETAQVGVAFADDRGVLTHANAALARLLGHPLATLRSATLSWRGLVPQSERDRLNHELARLRAEGLAGPIELDLLRADGTSLHSIFAASRLDDREHVAFIVDQTQQKLHEEHVGLLMRELNHRAKNTLALVQSIARQTRANSVPDFVERFSERIVALGGLQNLLVETTWSGADLERIVRDQLSHMRDALDARITIAGPPVVVTASAAQTIGLALHELATNAAKYGALSGESGRIAISWEHRPEGRLSLTWTESDGPPVTPPEHEGFGTTVVGAMVESGLGGEVAIAYRATGLSWRMECPLAALTS